MGFIGTFFIMIIALSYAELMLLLKASSNIGFLGTFGLCIFTAVVGGGLIRSEGIRVLFDLQKKLSQGKDPASTILGGVLLFVSGVLLLVPGFITDVFGFLMLIKPLREGIGKSLFRKISSNFKFSNINSGGSYDAEIRYSTYTFNEQKNFETNTKTNDEVNEPKSYIDVDYIDKKD